MVETRVREFRKQLGWSRAKLAVEADVGIELVRKVEQGRGVRTMQLGSIVKLAHGLGAAPADVVPALRVRPRAKAATVRARRALDD